ncbi:DUF5947 family protein [Actinoplanes sp. NPDC023714]|uniref:DUF5947 family protein n=1 Tax=Actinoplanes sp. NPDC023714 TaxID=3154322 RepID=UPI003400B3A3
MTSKAMLRRSGRPATVPPGGPRCALCGAAINPAHRHLLDVAQRSLVCGCPSCHDHPAGDRHEPVPDRYLEFPSDVLTQETWDDLRVPAGLAFISRTATVPGGVSLSGGGLVVCGPAPGGATEEELPATVWERLVRRHPAFATLRPGVEALLLRRAGCFLIPIDACYELAGLLRTSWRGYDTAVAQPDRARRSAAGGERARAWHPAPEQERTEQERTEQERTEQGSAGRALVTAGRAPMTAGRAAMRHAAAGEGGSLAMFMARVRARCHAASAGLTSATRA